jgi:hypothetical protein
LCVVGLIRIVVIVIFVVRVRNLSETNMHIIVVGLITSIIVHTLLLRIADHHTRTSARARIQRITRHAAL